jgi:hypothetical protein
MAGNLWRLEGAEHCPFFVERIDSVLQATKSTVLAFPLLADDTPGDVTCLRTRNSQDPASVRVAAATLRLVTLEDLVLPPHFGLVVADRHTGKTLFHSNPALAMGTNFVADINADAAYIATVDLADRRTLDLAYNGVPVRARVGPLTKGMPWTLVVYRTRDYEDRVVVAASALTVGTLAIWTVVTALLAMAVVGLGLLFRQQRRRVGDWLASVRDWICQRRWAVVTVGVLLSLSIAVPTVLIFRNAERTSLGGISEYVSAKVDARVSELRREARGRMALYEATRRRPAIWTEHNWRLDQTRTCAGRVTGLGSQRPDAHSEPLPGGFRSLLRKFTSSAMSAAILRPSQPKGDVQEAVGGTYCFDADATSAGSRPAVGWYTVVLRSAGLALLALVLALPCLAIVHLFDRPRHLFPLSPTPLDAFDLNGKGDDSRPKRLILVSCVENRLN